jgi:hypothetical protein
MALPFGVSIAALSLAQGAVVALPRALPPARLGAIRDRRWALVPPLSVIAFVLIVRAAEHASTKALTYLALVAVPLLAAFALAALVRGARPGLALLVAPLFVLAWADRTGLAGEGAAVVLSALSCAALGALISVVTPERWLAAGIIAMAAADTALVVSEQLQRPNSALNAAHPAAGLPRLQSAIFGSAVMGYGDLFIAGAFGGLLAMHCARREQLRGAVLTGAIALCLDLLFLLVDELPATVPVALALVALALAARWGSVTVRRAGMTRDAPPMPAPAGNEPRRVRAIQSLLVLARLPVRRSRRRLRSRSSRRSVAGR